jgi:hypothetical protein
MDFIADLISEIELEEKTASELLRRMQLFKANSPRSFQGLYRIPGFRKLWDALDESCMFSLRLESVMDAQLAELKAIDDAMLINAI